MGLNARDGVTVTFLLQGRLESVWVREAAAEGRDGDITVMDKDRGGQSRMPFVHGTST